jgi:hypothetical protein
VLFPERGFRKAFTGPDDVNIMKESEADQPDILHDEGTEAYEQ